MARKSLLTNADLAYVLRCERIRTKMVRKIGRQALATKLGVSMSCLSKYISGESITREQQLAQRNAVQTATELRRKRGDRRRFGLHQQELFNHV